MGVENEDNTEADWSEWGFELPRRQPITLLDLRFLALGFLFGAAWGMPL